MYNGSIVNTSDAHVTETKTMVTDESVTTEPLHTIIAASTTDKITKTTKKVSVKSTKVKKATKKKNSKKVYLKFKKVSSAQKYKIQISVNKKFKKKIINKKVNSKKISKKLNGKVNSKTTYSKKIISKIANSKNSKTIKFVLKDNKLKNWKKLYVRI
ncbi:hypothetical protein, partial [Eubacterium sp.]|uniref:hypothetical protein n=1 Tax=Eubacterium sp. TaxID=142586 RepID=UPI003A927528